MRIITDSCIRQWCDEFPQAASSLLLWHTKAKAAHWSNIQEVRRDFPHADSAIVRSGRAASIFNIKGNSYRLITAIHYNTGIVHTMLLLTHAEYSKNLWKDQL